MKDPVTLDDLQAICSPDSSGKVRFELTMAVDGRRVIRAIQGHSDGVVEPAAYETSMSRVSFDDCPEWLYHVTCGSNKDSIAMNGLLCGSRLKCLGKGSRAYVHMVDHVERNVEQDGLPPLGAADWVVCIRAKQLLKYCEAEDRPLVVTTTGVYLTRCGVPPTVIERFEYRVYPNGWEKAQNDPDFITWVEPWFSRAWRGSKGEKAQIQVIKDCEQECAKSQVQMTR
jgi:RNA:NAD 2'-phosphotransferase (TPT1/KptA family)